ncbi:MAG: hypothetical protein AAB113_10525 [Candidatus Eisenbacteria bacterium]
MHVARVAARLRNELGVPVEQLSGAYGEFTVLVDDEVVLTGGPLGWLSILPSADEVLQKVRARLSA